MTMTAPPLVGRHLDITYRVEEDRLHVVIRNEERGRAFWVTRRLCRGLLQGVVDLLARTSRTASRATADVRNDVLLFEHMGAISRREALEPPAPPHDGVRPAAALLDADMVLLQQIDLTISGDSMTLSMICGGHCLAVMTFSRDNVHQFAGMLFDSAHRAGWDFGEFAWLDKRSQLIFPENVTLS